MKKISGSPFLTLDGHSRIALRAVEDYDRSALLDVHGDRGSGTKSTGSRESEV